MAVLFTAGLVALQAAPILGIGTNTSSTSAQNLDGFFEVVFDAEAESGPAENLSATIPHVTVAGTTEEGVTHYYSFTVPAASYLGIFDIDHSEVNGIDSYLQLLAPDGVTVLAENDNSPFDGPGDEIEATLNSFVTYTFAQPGTYYLRLGQSTANDSGIGIGGFIASDAPYSLNASVGATVPEPASWLLVLGGIFGMFGVRQLRRQA